MVQHLFFDLDRTLWDFDTNSQIALRILFDKTQDRHRLTNFHKFASVYKDINQELWRKFGKGQLTKDALRSTRFPLTFEEFGMKDDDLNDFFSREYLHVSSQQTNLLPNAIATLSNLKKMGYSLHIITNGFKEVQTNKLINSKIRPFFDVVVSSEDVGINKPNKQIFVYALQLAKAKAEQSVMIGDDIRVDVIGAKQVGMKAIHFDPQQRYDPKKNYYCVKDLCEIQEILLLMEENQ